MGKLVLLAELKDKTNLEVMMNHQTYFGGNQHWFNKDIQVKGGCGPVCGFNALNYLYQSELRSNYTLEAMEEAYGIIHPFELENQASSSLLKAFKLPPSLGIFSLTSFRLGFRKYCKFKMVETNTVKMKAHGNLSKNVEFLKEELSKDHPVCMFNTFRSCDLYVGNTEIEKMDESTDLEEDIRGLRSQKYVTHWVLATALYQVENTKRYYVQCSTWGKVAYIPFNDYVGNRDLKDIFFASGYISVKLKTK